MRKVTTTSKINEALTNNLLQIQKAEVYYKTCRKTEIIDADKFYEDFGFLCESGVFMDALGWHYEWDCKNGLYVTECGRMNPDVESIIAVYLGICNGVCKENIERVLEVTEEE